MRVLSSCPHPTLGRRPLPEDARESFCKYISTKFYSMNVHFGKDLGVKLGPDMLALIRFLKKRDNEPDFRS